jgi:hypothetical protein
LDQFLEPVLVLLFSVTAVLCLSLACPPAIVYLQRIDKVLQVQMRRHCNMCVVILFLKIAEYNFG